MWRLLHRCACKPHVSFAALLALPLASCGSPQQRAQGYYEAGVKLLAEHQSQKAAIEFKNAVQLDWHLIPAWRGLARIEERDDHWQAVIPILRKIVELDPKDEATRVKLARLLLLAGVPEQSLKVINEAGEPNNSDAELLGLKAIILYKLNNHKSALRQAVAALKIDPGNVEALGVMASDRLANGDAQGALRVLSAAQTTDLGIELIKMEAYQKLADWPQVERILQDLTKRYPKDAKFRGQLVKFYIDRHRLGDAESELRKAVEADPKNIKAELDLVRFLYAFKGATAGRKELLTRIKSGGDVFPYEMALAEFDPLHGDFAGNVKLLDKLAGDASSPKHALAAKIKLAEIYLGRKEFDTAEKIVAGVLHDDSGNVSALRLRASIRIDRGQLQPAISDLVQALDRQPDSPQLMMLLATAYERAGSIALADQEYSNALRASNFNGVVGLRYAAFLQRHGGVVRAQAVLADLTNRQPNNVATLSALAETDLAQHDWAGAEKIGVSIRHIGGNDVIADQIMGAAFAGEQEFDASIAAFKKAVAAAPNAMESMSSLVRAFMLAKEPDQAVSFLQSALSTNPENAQAYVLLGSIKVAGGKPDEAAKDFMTAIEKQPKNAAGYVALGELYLSQKNAGAAMKVTRAGLEKQPDNVDLHLALAGIYERMQNYEAAISEYTYVLTQQPGSMVAANNLASLLADHRTDKASLQRAESLAASLQESQVPQFQDTLGWVDYRRGDFKAAVSLLEQAAAALPDVPLISYHLGMSYLAIGQVTNALNEFKTALAKSPSSELAEKIKFEIDRK